MLTKLLGQDIFLDDAYVFGYIPDNQCKNSIKGSDRYFDKWTSIIVSKARNIFYLVLLQKELNLKMHIFNTSRYNNSLRSKALDKCWRYSAVLQVKVDVSELSFEKFLIMLLKILKQLHGVDHSIYSIYKMRYFLIS